MTDICEGVMKFWGDSVRKASRTSLNTNKEVGFWMCVDEPPKLCIGKKCKIESKQINLGMCKKRAPLGFVHTHPLRKYSTIKDRTMPSFADVSFNVKASKVFKGYAIECIISPSKETRIPSVMSCRLINKEYEQYAKVYEAYVKLHEEFNKIDVSAKGSSEAKDIPTLLKHAKRERVVFEQSEAVSSLLEGANSMVKRCTIKI